jgi:predicted nucleotidyltransferase
MAQTSLHLPIEVPAQRLTDLCRRWRVQELALFGSVLRDDFGPASDVDVLVTFAPGATWSLFDMARMQEELEALLGRQVDLVDRKAIERSENYIRRKKILESPMSLYVAS